ncbi:hypothetical protein E2C01_066689 [Portunus trituberculatus]|uniref:Uncharacterized protein n=1 Tax=Portunus trituberculatus TaxID=210409 RepID=A0A5B7HRM5_PORTR|nr:hypothetical protein [Portunus trituberculatus]
MTTGATIAARSSIIHSYGLVHVASKQERDREEKVNLKETGRKVNSERGLCSTEPERSNDNHPRKNGMSNGILLVSLSTHSGALPGHNSR